MNEYEAHGLVPGFMGRTDVLKCARCGEEHTGLAAWSFRVPVAPPELAPFRWTHWATCPTSNDPILFGNPTETVRSGEVATAHARNAYEAFFTAKGEAPPLTFDSLPESERNAWFAVVYAVLR